MTQEFKKRIAEVLLLAIVASESEEYNVNIEVAGHVSSISLRIYKEWEDVLFKDEFYYLERDWSRSLNHNSECLKKLDQWKVELLKIIAPPISVTEVLKVPKKRKSLTPAS